MKQDEFFQAVTQSHAGAEPVDDGVVVDRGSRGRTSVTVRAGRHPAVEFRFTVSAEGAGLYRRLSTGAARALTLEIGSALYWDRSALCVRATCPQGEFTPATVDWANRTVGVFRRVVLESAGHQGEGAERWADEVEVSKEDRRAFMRTVSHALPGSVDGTDGVSVAPSPDGLLLVTFTGRNRLAVALAATGACGRLRSGLKANGATIARRLGFEPARKPGPYVLRIDCPFPPFHWDRADERARDWAIATAQVMRSQVLVPLRVAARSGEELSGWLERLAPDAPPGPAVPSAASIPAPAGAPESGPEPSPLPSSRQPVRPEVLCGVCGKPVRNGLIRHQQCERVRRDGAGAGEPGTEPVGGAGGGEAAARGSRKGGDYRTRLESLAARGSAEREVSEQARRRRYALARALVVEQCVAQNGGYCENPHCANPTFREIARSGEPILEVDHVDDHASGGADHPANMIALCPNCHAVKTRGVGGEELRTVFRAVAEERHARALRA